MKLNYNNKEIREKVFVVLTVIVMPQLSSYHQSFRNTGSHLSPSQRKKPSRRKLIFFCRDKFSTKLEEHFPTQFKAVYNQSITHYKRFKKFMRVKLADVFKAESL